MAEEDRTLAEDFTTPVEIQPGMDRATPEDWTWRNVSSSQPNAAIFHISHSESTRVLIDSLGPKDSTPEAYFRLKKEIPIVVLDSLDSYWAGESKVQLPLAGIRVPVEGKTVREAKEGLATDLAAQLRLLLLLSSSHQGKIAPELLKNMEYLSSIMEPHPDSDQ
ncbi:MAG: hypothetical protein FI717_09365 [SAR202 cluster bacterium]|nr:hypothetical protein [Chloroflexota bacterium]MQF95971.1 hypothetical protein [SAR202 cluster bacterium]HAA95936.1 hypothetical protein [Dehalococcoidia bacterium]MQG34496.1 hypothetical protein [SAR202 cluster bacterium]HCL25774.1 hypothetical protein [Dehalococcoidia bacterium]|tara:strand:- start:584 stop:1075 length:492 start_codon:yes stop_codon:yes gene_type:complete